MQQTGRVTVKMESDSLQSKPGASFNPGGVNRPHSMTDQMSSYYREEPYPARVKCTIIHCSTTNYKKLQNFKNGTVFFTTDSGHVYTVSHASTASIGDLVNGEVDIEFGGDPADVG